MYEKLKWDFKKLENIITRQKSREKEKYIMKLYKFQQKIDMNGANTIASILQQL